MFTYIKKNIKGFYVEFPEELSIENFSNLGKSYEDFLDNKWVLLSDEQLAFHEGNPNASVKEVLAMQLNEVPVRERTLEDAKQEMLHNIDIYDNSEAVNSFTINNAITAWFTPQERTNYKNSIDSAKLLGVNELSFFIGNMLITVSTEQAEKMLAAIQLYADACFIVTKQHKVAVESFDDIAIVDTYDYTVGYPEKLNFNI